MNFLQIFKFGTEIVEILQNCCYFTKFLYEIAKSTSNFIRELCNCSSVKWEKNVLLVGNDKNAIFIAIFLFCFLCLSLQESSASCFSKIPGDLPKAAKITTHHQGKANM